MDKINNGAAAREKYVTELADGASIALAALIQRLYSADNRRVRLEQDNRRLELERDAITEKYTNQVRRNAELRKALNDAQRELADRKPPVEPGSKFNGDPALLDLPEFQARFNQDLLAALQPLVDDYGFALVAIQAEFIAIDNPDGSSYGFEMRLGRQDGEREWFDPDAMFAQAAAAAEPETPLPEADVYYLRRGADQRVELASVNETIRGAQLSPGAAAGTANLTAGELRQAAIDAAVRQDGIDMASSVGITAEMVEVTRSPDGVHLFIPGLELVPMREVPMPPTASEAAVVHHRPGTYGPHDGGAQLYRA